MLPDCYLRRGFLNGAGKIHEAERESRQTHDALLFWDTTMAGIDVIFDANLITTDVAFRSPQTVEMLAYLGRAGSRLVIPTWSAYYPDTILSASLSTLYNNPYAPPDVGRETVSYEAQVSAPTTNGVFGGWRLDELRLLSWGQFQNLAPHAQIHPISE